jgi:hypothetical protein
MLSRSFDQEQLLVCLKADDHCLHPTLTSDILQFISPLQLSVPQTNNNIQQNKDSQEK